MKIRPRQFVCVKAQNEGELDLRRPNLGGVSRNPDRSNRLAHEDSALIKVFNKGNLLVVADGMAGSRHGALASSIVIDTFLDYFKPKIFYKRLFALLCRQAHQNICNTRISGGLISGGTTIEAAFISGNEAFFSHLGDSRTYLIRGEQVSLLFPDQIGSSEIFLKCEANNGFPLKLTSDRDLPLYYEKMNEPSKMNGLYAFAGTYMFNNYSPPEQQRLILQENDIILMCSDGLNFLQWDDFYKLTQTIHDYGALGAARLFFYSVFEPGDNITVLIYIHQNTP